MLKLTLMIGGDLLDVSGDDVTIGDVFPVISDFLDALPGGDLEAQRDVDRLTARLAAATTKLQHDVGAATPTS